MVILTISVGGLEVYYEPEDRWCPVKYIPDAYVVNIGDMMGMDPVHIVFVEILTISPIERWTNNRYKSTRHRVISPVSGKDRYSIAFFNEGLLDQVLECIPTCIEEGERPLHESITVETHLRSRYGGTY